MQILRRISIALVWFAGLVFVFAAANKNDPYLISLRGPGNIMLAVASIVVVVVLLRCGYGRRGVAARLLILLWCLPSLSMLGAQASFEWRRRSVLQADAAQARSLGRHFVVGYSSFPEVAVLAEKGGTIRAIKPAVFTWSLDGGVTAASDIKITWDVLNAYIDGELDRAMSARVAAAAAQDTTLAARFATLSKLKASTPGSGIFHIKFPRGRLWVAAMQAVRKQT